MSLGRPARLVFFGSDEIALPALEAIRTGLAGSMEIVAVFSQPDRPTGRGQKVQPNAISAWAQERGILLFRPEKLDEHTPAILQGLCCDIALVMAYGHILKRALLDTPPLGFYNLHGSLLPKFRGATPVEGAIVAGESVTGVSLQRVVAKLDAGDVVDAESFTLTREDTTASVRDRLAQLSVPLALRALPAIISGRATFTSQDEALVSHTRKIHREDAVFDFSATAFELETRTRALNPWPGVTVPFGEIVLKVGRAESAPETIRPADAAPGTVLGADKRGLLVATGEGVLRLTELQRPGGKMLPAPAFLAGCPIPVGTVFESRPMAPLVGREAFKVVKKLP
jgi:methionyl-tRNA formyltransferase